jgi:hypothetical protein
MMSNGRSGFRDVRTVMGHEFGHVPLFFDFLRGQPYNEQRSNDSALDLENKVRKLVNPQAPTRKIH